MMPPDLNTHLDWVLNLKDDNQLRQAIDVLLDLPTCFVVIGGELQIRTTERGANALAEHLL